MKLTISKDLNYSPEHLRLAGEFVIFCGEHLNIEGDYQVFIVSEREPHGISTTAVYEVGNNCCRVYAKNRHLADVLRSIAHEMTHMMQDQTGLITGPVQDAGGFHEDQANAKAGEIIKLFAKSKPDRRMIYENKKVSKKKKLKRVYHGSPVDFDKFELKPHYLLDKPGVFAADNIEQALCSLQKWNDDMFEQGVVDNDPLHFKEKKKNILEKTYKGKEGWLYVLDGKTFEHKDNLMRTEVVSYSVPKIIKKIYIKDSLKALEKSDLIIFKHNENKKFKKYIEGK